MSTLAKIESNRRNAKRSTGPRTTEGKTRSSMNAVRHGLLSRQITLPDEDPDAFAEFLESMTGKLAPAGPLEEVLVERIAVIAWRLRRAVRLESGVIAHRTREVQDEQAGSRPSADLLAAGLIRDAAGADALSKLGRYERSLDRGLYRALEELQRLQAGRPDRVVPQADASHAELSTSLMDPRDRPGSIEGGGAKMKLRNEPNLV